MVGCSTVALSSLDRRINSGDKLIVEKYTVVRRRRGEVFSVTAVEEYQKDLLTDRNRNKTEILNCKKL